MYEINQPLYGKPRPRERIWTPAFVQSATGSSGSSSNGGRVTLGSAPSPGNLLLAIAASIEFSPTPTVLGGGVATWTSVGTTGQSGGSQVRIAGWIGVVGRSKPQITHFTIQNTCAFIVAEFNLRRHDAAGLPRDAAGSVRNSTTGTNTTGTLTLADIQGYFEGGLKVWGWAYRTVGTPGTPAGFTVLGPVSNNVVLRGGYSLAPYYPRQPFAAQFTGSTGNQGAFAAIVQ